MEGDGGGRLERGGEGFELFDKVSSVAAFGITMTPTRESGKRVKDTIGKKGTQLLAIDRKRVASSEAPRRQQTPTVESAASGCLGSLLSFIGEYKSAD